MPSLVHLTGQPGPRGRRGAGVVRRALPSHVGGERISQPYCGHMMRRTTVEIDDEVLARAKKALGLEQTKETVDAALRGAAESREAAERALRQRQLDTLRRLREWADVDVLAGNDMWR